MSIKATCRFKKRYIPIGIIVLVLILLAFRVYLPFWVTNYVNEKLDGISGYQAEIENVDIHLWRGAYSINELNMLKENGDQTEPFVKIESVELSIEWKAIFNGKVVGEVELLRPQMNFIRAKNNEATQVKVSESWMEQGKKLFPFQINRLTITEGRINYRDENSEPLIDLKLTQVNAYLKNIRNVKSEGNSNPSDFRLEGNVFESGFILAEGNADLLKEIPDFIVKLKVSGIQLIEVNDFVRHYGKFDFESGSCDVIVEITAKESAFDGYVKPILEDIRILDIERDYTSPISAIWETITSGLLQLFKNHPKDRLATKIPISGTVGDPDIGVIPTITNIFKNAFVEAFRPNWEAETK